MRNRILRAAFAGAIGFAAAIAIAPAAEATTFDFSGYSLPAGINGQVQDGSLNVNEGAYVGLIALNGQHASAGITKYVYCIDIKDWLTGGLFSTVTSTTLPGLEARFGYTNQQIDDVGYLLAAHYDPAHPTAVTAVQAAALQAAIWEVLDETPANVWNVTSGDFKITTYGSDSWAPTASVVTTANGYLSTLATQLANHTATMGSAHLAIIDPGTGNQPQAYISLSRAEDTPLPSVPEPATWAMIVMGFGVLGATLRRRKQDESLFA